VPSTKKIVKDVLHYLSICEWVSGLVVGGGSGQLTHSDSTLNRSIPVMSRQTHAQKRSGVEKSSQIQKKIFVNFE
jgi:hypothetical protein